MSGKTSWCDADIARGERTARKVFVELGIRHPTEASIEALAYLRGAIVRDIPMRGAVGRLTRVGRAAIISVSTGVTFAPRRRWTIAHEMGHLELHPDGNVLELCDERNVSELYDSGIEREANAFASELLMPRSLWEKRADVKQPTIDLASALADEFQVSLTASLIRLVKLSPDRCCVVFAVGGKIVWFARSPDFGYWLERGTKLDSYSLAYDYFSKGLVGSRPEAVSAHAWLSPCARVVAA